MGEQSLNLKMKSSVRLSYGPPDILTVQEVSRPVPSDNQLLVRVHAATVNRTDCGALWGKPFIFRFFVGFPRPRYFATGSDFAGTVMAVGKLVSKFKIGDRVFGFNDHGIGSHAEYMAIAEDQPIRTIPSQISFEQAAASLEGFHYAYNFVKKVTLQNGDRVLVNGATGAVGAAAVQILRHFGCEVIATCATENIERVRALGANQIIDYTQEDFTKKNLQSYDFVFDAVGKSRFSLCKPLLKPKGVYISSELGPNAENLYLALLTPLKGGKKLIFPLPSDIKSTLTLVCDLFEKGRLTPLIDRVYPLSRIAEAFDYVNSGQKIGNVLLKPNPT